MSVVPNRRRGDCESPQVPNVRNIQFATAGRTEMLAAGNFRDWNTQQSARYLGANEARSSFYFLYHRLRSNEQTRIIPFHVI